MIIHDFYSAFQRKDIKSMQACYAAEARFSDPVFRDLNQQEVCQMWAMLLSAGKDLEIEYGEIENQGNHASARWQATYTFTATGRRVVNHIQAEFELCEGKIYQHRDHFNFYRWAQQAFGLTGYLIGWTPFFQRKVQASARHSLQKYMVR